MEYNPAAFAPPQLPAAHPCSACPVRLRTFCRTLDQAELEHFRSGGRTISLAAAQALFHQGDPADQVCNLTSGTLKLSQLLADGRRQVIGFLFPGDFLGTADEHEFPFSAEALEPAEICRFPRARFEQSLHDHPPMERAMLRLTSRELAMAREQLVLLGRKTAEERFASFLLMLKARAPDPAGTDTIRLPMNRTDIADYLGLTKETVSRLFTAFKTSGLIRLHAAGLVRLLDFSRLGDMAAGAAHRRACR